MLEWLFTIFSKIGSLFSWNSNSSLNSTTNASTQNGPAVAVSGNHSPVHIGDILNAPKFEINPELRFKNCLVAVAHELPFNFRNRGNAQNPFLTQALEKLVYDEPMIHDHPELFRKASTCLNTAKTLSTAEPYHPIFKPADGQNLMKDLADFISATYGIKGSDPK